MESDIIENRIIRASVFLCAHNIPPAVHVFAQPCCPAHVLDHVIVSPCQWFINRRRKLTRVDFLIVALRPEIMVHVCYTNDKSRLFALTDMVCENLNVLLLYSTKNFRTEIFSDKAEFRPFIWIIFSYSAAY